MHQRPPDSKFRMSYLILQGSGVENWLQSLVCLWGGTISKRNQLHGFERRAASSFIVQEGRGWSHRVLVIRSRHSSLYRTGTMEAILRLKGVTNWFNNATPLDFRRIRLSYPTMQRDVQWSKQPKHWFPLGEISKIIVGNMWANILTSDICGM